MFGCVVCVDEMLLLRQLQNVFLGIDVMLALVLLELLLGIHAQALLPLRRDAHGERALSIIAPLAHGPVLRGPRGRAREGPRDG